MKVFVRLTILTILVSLFLPLLFVNAQTNQFVIPTYDPTPLVSGTKGNSQSVVPITTLTGTSPTSPTNTNNNSNANNNSGNSSYVPLQNIQLPNGNKLYDASSIAEYLQIIYSFGVAIAGGLAVIMIVFGGIEYMLAEAFTNKTAAKNRITAALIGLLLALCSYALLYTINPELVKLKFNLSQTTVPNSSDGLGFYAGTGTGQNVSPIGNVASLTKQGTTFPDAGWNTYALQQINQSGLLDLSPSDVAIYFPNSNGKPTAQDYLNLIASMANKESGFDPNNTYYEKTMAKNSVGLLQLSADDAVVKNLGYSEQDLKNPYNNIQAGVQILKNQIQSGGCITCTNGTYQNGATKYSGASAYWSTLR